MVCLVSKFFTARALPVPKLVSPRILVQTGYTTPTLRFSDTLNHLVGVV